MSDAEQVLVKALMAQGLDDAPLFACENSAEVVLGALEEHLADTVRWLAETAGVGPVVAALVDAGGLVHAGCWDAPDVTDEDLDALEGACEAARDRFREAAKKAEAEDPPIPQPEPRTPEARRHRQRVTERENRLTEATAAEWDAYMEAEGDLNERRELRDRVTVYYEDEDRPTGAVPLYRIGGAS